MSGVDKTGAQVSEDERILRLRQLNDLHNLLVNTAREKFCPALRWAMDQLGCPDAAASRSPRRQRPIEPDEGRSIAAEHYWKDKQGDEYGSY